MTITICGSMKFHDDMVRIQAELGQAGHTVFMPIKAKGVDYWEKDGSKRIAAKKGLDLIGEHMRKIGKSDAILVVNMDKNEVKNYIGANTFIEIGYAHFIKKKIFLLNSIPDLPYIFEELTSTEPIVINGDLKKIK
jgi:hypothetical protein